jgi:hypothetical protein
MPKAPYWPNEIARNTARCEELQTQMKELQEMHTKLAEHCHKFMTLTVEHLGADLEQEE